MRFLSAIALLIAASALPAAAERVCVEQAGDVCLKYRTTTPESAEAKAERALGLSRSDRETIQRRLKAEGRYSGPIDGAIGPMSRRALRDWQTANGHAATGYLTAAQALALTAQDATAAAAAADPRDGFWVGRLKCQSMSTDFGNPPHSRPEGQSLTFKVDVGEGVWTRGPKKPGLSKAGETPHERLALTLYEDGRALIVGQYEYSRSTQGPRVLDTDVAYQGRWLGQAADLEGFRGPRPCEVELTRY